MSDHYALNELRDSTPEEFANQEALREREEAMKRHPLARLFRRSSGARVPASPPTLSEVAAEQAAELTEEERDGRIR